MMNEILDIHGHKFNIVADLGFTQIGGVNYGGGLTATPLSSSDLEYAAKFVKAISDKGFFSVEKLMGCIDAKEPKIDEEFLDESKYNTGLSFIKTFGVCSNGKKFLGLWPSRIEDNVITFTFDEIQ